MRSYLIGSGRVFYSIVIFLLTVFASRYFNIEDYGTFREFYLFFVAIVAISGVPAINPVYYFRTKDRNTLLIIAVFSLIIAFMISVILHLILEIPYLYVLLLSAGASCVYLMSEAVLLVTNRHKAALFMTILESLTFILPVPLIIMLSLNLNQYMRIFAVIAVLKFIIYALFLLVYSEKSSISKMILFRYSVPVYINSFVGMLSTRVDKYAVSGLFGPQVFAYYSSGAFEIPLINRFINGVFHSIAGELRLLIESGKKDEVKRQLRHKLSRLCLIIGAVAILLTVNAKPFITLVYSSKYSDAFLFFIIYLTVLPLRIVPVGFLLSLTGRTRALMYISIADALMTIGLSIMLILIMGPVGGAIAYVSITILQVFATVTVMRDIFPSWFFFTQYLLIIAFTNAASLFILNGGNIILGNACIMLFVLMYALIFRRNFR